MESNIKQRRKKSPEAALASLMRLCARGEKCSCDALRLMRGWGVEPTEQQKILHKLIQERYIDDSRYAKAYTREKCSINGWGEIKIRQMLRTKGIENAIIAEALEEINQRESTERLRERLKRKLRTIKASTPFELRAKLIRYGVSLGFDYQSVNDTANYLLKQEQTECDIFFD